MALTLIGSTRDAFVARTSGTMSARGWHTWDTATLPAWAQLGSSGECLVLPAGRWRVEILEGKPLTYVDGKNAGEKPAGVYILEGQRTQIYCQAYNASGMLVATRLV